MVAHTTTGHQRRSTPPAGATDCHLHIYDQTAGMARAGVPHAAATAADYRALQAHLGLTRCVIVQPSAYGTDNAVTLNGVAELGPDARAVGVLDDSIDDAALRDMDAAGMRGVRFNLLSAGALPPAMIAPLAAKVAPLGWHVQLHLSPAMLVDLQDTLASLPCPIVFDHLARLSALSDPAWPVLRRLLDAGRTFVKLSGAYHDSLTGPPFADTAAVARAILAAAPERCVWGTDWPHPSEPAGRKPDDALMLDLLADWAPGDAWRRVLVDNPAGLYHF